MTEWFVLPPQSSRSYAWWVSLVTLGCVSVVLFLLAWCKTGRAITRDLRAGDVPAWSVRYSRGMRLLAFPYVFECVYRSFFPALYNFRLTFFDTAANAVLVNRSLAFVGEIAWVAQIAWAVTVVAAVMPLKGSAAAQARLRRNLPVAAKVMVALSVLANVMSVAGMVSTSNLYNVIEETCWLVIFLLGGICGGLLLLFGTDAGWCGDDDGDGIPNALDKDVPASLAVMRWFLRFLFLFGIVYSAYMVAEDIPKYVQRYNAEQALGDAFQPLGFVEGFRDAAERRVVTQRWEDWDQDWFWQSAYFSAGCWTAIALMFAPGRVEPAAGSNAGVISGVV